MTIRSDQKNKNRIFVTLKWSFFFIVQYCQFLFIYLDISAVFLLFFNREYYCCILFSGHLTLVKNKIYLLKEFTIVSIDLNVSFLFVLKIYITYDFCCFTKINFLSRIFCSIQFLKYKYLKE